MIKSLMLLPYLIGLLFFFCGKTEAFVPNFGFWKNQSTFSLKYTTTSQTIRSELCSNLVTVKSYNPADVLTNVPSNLTVSLIGNGSTTFYSDSRCLTPITSVTIASGTNSASFYFSSNAAGSFSLVSSASGYKNASQSQTITSNPFIWTGSAGSTAWNTAGNWSGGVAPGVSDIAVFNNNCTTFCSPTISGNISVAGFLLKPTYTGTITQGPGVTITVGASSWIQSGGAFNGGNSAFTINGQLYVESGSFTFPSSTLQVSNNVTLKNSASFVTTNSTLLFACSYGATCVINTEAASLNHVSFQGSYTNYSLANNTMTVLGNLSLGDNYGPSETSQPINLGTINVNGNITVINNGFRGTAVIVAKGNVGGQTISGIANRYMPSLRIDAGTNPVTISGTLFISGGYTFTSAGSLTVAGSSITLFCPMSTTCALNPGTITYNNFSLTSFYGNYNLGGGSLRVGGLFSAGDSYGSSYISQKIDNGTILAYGNVTIINYGYQGSASVVIAGNASGQTVTGAGPNFLLPNLTISAGTNQVTFSGVISTAPTFTMNSVGSFITTGSTLTLYCDYGITCSINPGTATYNNVALSGYYSSFTLNGNTMNVGGNLNLGDRFGGGYLNQPINSGTFNVSGNINVVNNGNSGTAVIVATGNPSGQIITSTTSKNMPNLQINTGANSVSIATGLKVLGNLNITAGSLNMAGNNLTVTSLLSIASGSTLTKSGGILTYGSLSNSGTINP